VNFRDIEGSVERNRGSGAAQMHGSPYTWLGPHLIIAYNLCLHIMFKNRARENILLYKFNGMSDPHACDDL